jgi:hypothetical protein
MLPVVMLRRRRLYLADLSPPPLAGCGRELLLLAAAAVWSSICLAMAVAVSWWFPGDHEHPDAGVLALADRLGRLFSE